jgi:hypothetical protein
MAGLNNDAALFFLPKTKGLTAIFFSSKPRLVASLTIVVMYQFSN